MNTPANIRVNVRAPFPAVVQGAGFISVAKANGWWTIGVNYLLLAPLINIADLGTSDIAIYDPVTKQYNTVTANQIAALASTLVPRTQRLVSSSVGLPILASDSIVNLNLSAQTAIVIPPAASRAGAPLKFRDVGGTWGGANVPTFSPSVFDTFDGSAAALTPTLNRGWIEFIPLNDGVSGPGYTIEGLWQ